MHAFLDIVHIEAAVSKKTHIRGPPDMVTAHPTSARSRTQFRQGKDSRSVRRYVIFNLLLKIRVREGDFPLEIAFVALTFEFPRVQFLRCESASGLVLDAYGEWRRTYHFSPFERCGDNSQVGRFDGLIL